jgi:hypothetical protein
MFEPNATKITMLFPVRQSNGEPFSEGTWDWWLANISSFGLHDQRSTRSTWKGKPRRYRFVQIWITDEAELGKLETFLHETREVFAQDVYFEAVRVHLKIL